MKWEMIGRVVNNVVTIDNGPFVFLYSSKTISLYFTAIIIITH